MKLNPLKYIFFFILVFWCIDIGAQKSDDRTIRSERKLLKKSDFIPELFSEWKHLGKFSIDSIDIKKQDKIIDYYLNPLFIQLPVRDEMIANIKSAIIKELKRSQSGYKVQLWIKNRPFEDYIPNYFRSSFEKYDRLRMSSSKGSPLVTDLSRPPFTNGLYGNYIALWPSHGLYFDQKTDQWRWQRARLWQTVEDIFPRSFTMEYLIPMLENAGATVLIPRERDVQKHEIIIDNNGSTEKSFVIKIAQGKSWDSTYYKGFKWSDTLFPGQNPFQMGTSLSVEYVHGDSSSLTYVPDIPEDGNYAVYVSYASTGNCVNDARYEVFYSGGKAEFLVNQCMSAGTWVYLGNFRFKKGIDIKSAAVKVSGNKMPGILSSDAVRFGGGIGNVARRPFTKSDSIESLFKTSGKPRWTEGSRYYLQFAGMPDSIVYSFNKETDDYKDDYMSRPEWVNYLIGASRPQYTNKYNSGLNIPIDLVFALHSDAGITPNDSVIGTLGIYSTVRNNGIFPDGRSKLAARDLTDLIQTQVVSDIRIKYNTNWIRRGLWDREYSEAWRPIVPTAMLELLSHQNLADMKYGLDPRFKFDVARSIYKGILRYQSTSDGQRYVVQPLPPNHMAIDLLGKKQIKITWKPVYDEMEPTAKPDLYNVYQAKENSGFSKILSTGNNSIIIELPEWNSIFNFYVTSVNSGGESFPTETLSVSLADNDIKPVLVVNAFDRISAPSFFDKAGMAGIAWWEDEGVPRGKDLGVTGHQYDYDRSREWINDDNQGWGASNADFETITVAGNTFDFPLRHGKAIRDAGYSFTSMSDEALDSVIIDNNKYFAVDFIFGEEKGTVSYKDTNLVEFRVFTPQIIKRLSQYAQNGGNILISGAYIGTDMIDNKDAGAITFSSNVLHFVWRTSHSTSRGYLTATDQGVKFFPKLAKFNTDISEDIYRVESPDAIEPEGKGAFRIYRYTSGNNCAGIAFKGDYKIVVFGFPFETIIEENERTQMMKGILNFFSKP